MSESNHLEDALKKAVSAPEAREAFYEALMASSVYVVGREEPQEDGSPAHVQLKQWQQPDGYMALPFFASLDSLRELLGDDEPYLSLPAVELFKSAGDVTLVLTTPEGSKAFKPDEIAALLSSAMALDPLAKALDIAAREGTEDTRKNFYNVLINSQAFVLGRPADETVRPGQGVREIKPDDQFMINACPHPFLEGQKALPFFSSLEHLKRMAPPDSQYMGFSALHILSMARQMKLPPFLNPGFEANKLFADDEVEYLLNAAAEEPFEQRRYAPGSQIYLGQPDEYPQEMVSALLDFLPKYPEVRSAYLALMREGSEEAPPVLVIGFEADGDLTKMFRAAGPVVGEFAEDGLPIDFAEVKEGESGLSQYFLSKASPFYRRALNGSRQPAEDERNSGDSADEKNEQPGFFGGLKKIFSDSK